MPLRPSSLLLLPPAWWLLETVLSLEPRLLLFAKQLSPALRKRDFCADKEKGKRHGHVDSWDGTTGGIRLPV